MFDVDCNLPILLENARSSIELSVKLTKSMNCSLNIALMSFIVETTANPQME